MKRFYKQFLIAGVVIITVSLLSIMVVTAEAPVGDEIITSEAAIVIDHDTGLVIYQHNIDALRVPASMTKMIAVYVVLDAIRDGIISYDTIIEVSDNASDFSFDRAYTNVPMPRDSSYTVRELLDVVIVRSAGAATVALGEGIYGSEEELVSKMNEKMSQLGINASFSDCWGGSRDNRISARGMADMTRALVKEYPEVLSFTSQSSVMFDEISYGNTNMLIGEYDGVDGLKTGFTNPAGWCFTATALQEERRIISVTMGSEQGYRFSDSVILLDYGFDNYGPVIADHFRSSLQSSDLLQTADTTLVPITMYNIDEAANIELRNLALILNED